MPFKDPEKQKEYKRELMRKRRAAKKAGQGIDHLAGPSLSPFKEPEGVTNPPAPEPPQAVDGKVHETFHEPEGDLELTPEVSPVPESIPISEAIPNSNSDFDFEPELHIIDDPHEVADESRRRLDTQGWVVWNCDIFGGEPIVIIKDETVTGYPEDLPSYTEDELKRFIELPPDAMRRINTLKVINPGSRYLETITKED